MIKNITCSVALNPIKNKAYPYSWDLNIYRGCQHNCEYCYALYSHKYLNSDNFFDDIYVKKNIAEQLEKKLSSRYWKKSVINIGGVTDSYQPIEKQQKIMRDILQIMIKYENPITICTKSNLILRDLDLIKKLSNLTHVSIALSLITTNEKLKNIIEPFSPSLKNRIETLKILKQNKINTGILLMPILPFLTDNENNLELIFKIIKDYKLDYIIPGTLNLKGQTKTHFLNFLKNEFPKIYPKYLNLYKTSTLPKEYKIKVYKIINNLKQKYNINSNYKIFKPPTQKSFNL